MAPINKDPFRYSKNGGGGDTFLGLVQAGASQTIKVGELSCFDKTTGYFVPVSAVADSRYMLAISKEEQKATGRGELTAERYINFYSLHPDDVFEFPIDAARALALGDTFTLTASDSQKLTYGAGDYAVAISVSCSHYPHEEDTAIRDQPEAFVTFNPQNTFWGLKRSIDVLRKGRRVISSAGNITLIETDCYGGTLVLITSAGTVILPPVKPGMDLFVMSTGGNAIHVDPADADKIRLAGAQLTDGDKLTSASGAGDCVHLFAEDADGWCSIMESGTWTDGN